jgi:hypothetical protein
MTARHFGVIDNKSNARSGMAVMFYRSKDPGRRKLVFIAGLHAVFLHGN